MLRHYHWFLIQQSSLLPYNHWFSKLPYKLTIPNLIHYYTIIDTATLWNNTLDPTINYPNIHDSIQLSLRYDTWDNYQYTYTPFDIYPYATILDTTTSNYYDTPRIQQAFLCPYDSLDTTPTSYILQLIQHLNTMITLIQQQRILLYITWYNTRYAIWIQKPIAILPRTRQPPARCWRTPTDAHTRSG